MPGAVDSRRLVDLPRQRVEVTLHQERVHAQRAAEVDEGESPDAAEAERRGDVEDLR